MPAPGDQHKPSGNTTQNPFEEVTPHISEYTAQEIATLTARLNQRLGPEYISTRTGPGNSRVAYLPAEKAINLANEVFGFNGWSSSIQNIQIDFVDENATKGTISIGLSVIVRVTLKDGTYHEDTGYGGIDNCKSKIAAFEKAKKEGTTDALKRALRNFGNVLGNCIYDKDYITKVSKVKAGTGKWDVNELYRHADFAPKKEELDTKVPVADIASAAQPRPQPNIPQQPPAVPSLIGEDSFDVNEFDEADLEDLGNPDEVILPPDTHQNRNGPTPNQPNGRQPQPPAHQHQMTPSKPPQPRPDSNQYNPHANHGETRQPPHLRPQQQQQQLAQGQTGTGTSRSSSPGIPSQHFSAAAPPPANGQIGFFSAKIAENLDMNNNPTNGAVIQRFNPHAESPSIRKTSGVDHSTSAALNRKTLKVEPPIHREEPPQPGAGQASAASRPIMRSANTGGFSPIGAGRGAGGMTSAYRPPTRQGPPMNNANTTPVNTTANVNGPMPGSTTTPASMAQGAGGRTLTAAKRAPLGDLSNVQSTHAGNGGAEGGDVKRQRIGPGLSGHPDGQNPGPPGVQ